MSALAKTSPGSVLRCVGSDGTVFQAIFWISGVTGAEMATEDKEKAGAMAKAPGALLLPGLSRPPGTGVPTGFGPLLAPWQPGAGLAKGKERKGINIQVAVFATSSRLRPAVAQVQCFSQHQESRFLLSCPPAPYMVGYDQQQAMTTNRSL